MIPGVYNMESFTQGDWWEGVPFIRILVNDEPPIFPVASVRMQFRSSQGRLGTVELNSTNGDITIEDAPLWRFSIPAQELPLADGRWLYDFETTDSEGVVKTYLKGSITVTPDTTR